MNQSQNIVLSPWPTLPFQYCFTYQNDTVQKSKPEVPHIHDCYEIYVNISGDVAFLVNNQLYPISKGDVVVTRPGDVHICIYQSDAPHERFCFWINCSDESPLLAFTRWNDFSNYIHYSEDTRRELLRLLFRLKDAESDAKEPARTAYAFRILTLFSEREQMSPERLSLPKQLQDVLDYIHGNFTELRAVSDIAKATHASSSTLNRWFRNHLQLSPHKYVEALKLSYAQRLLLEGRSVTEVCGRSGFSDCSRFIAVFKEKFGETPLQYQKRRSI